MPGQRRYSGPVMVGVLAAVSFVLAVLLSTRTVFGRDSENDNGGIARGAGTTIIHGGTGAPHFFPVVTTIALHAGRSCAEATGEFSCLGVASWPPGAGPRHGALSEE